MVIDNTTELYAVVGNRVDHSHSPTIHNESFRKNNINAVFISISIPEQIFEKSFRTLQEAKLSGLAIILPYKQKVLNLCDYVEDDARLIGAVNTIHFKLDGKVYGYNTDALASIRCLLEAGAKLQSAKALILGAGGATRAIAFRLALDGISKLTIANRTESKAISLVNDIKATLSSNLECSACGLEPDVLAKESLDADIIINTSSVGMYPDINSTLLMANNMRKGQYVFDIVYNPIKTKLLEEAEKAGATPITGDFMLVYQAVEQERIWTAREVAWQPMLAALRQALDKENIYNA